MSARGERGSAVVAVLAVLLVLALLGASALSLSGRRVETSTAERDTQRALAAADAGADVAGLRMNRTLVGSTAAGVTGLTSAALRTAGCLGVDAAGRSLVTTAGAGQAFCAQTADEPVGDGSRFRYAVGTEVDVAGPVVRRRVVTTGLAGRAVKRLVVLYELDLDAAAPARLFRRVRWAPCTSRPAPGRPDAGCPQL